MHCTACEQTPESTPEPTFEQDFDLRDFGELDFGLQDFGLRDFGELDSVNKTSLNGTFARPLSTPRMSKISVNRLLNRRSSVLVAILAAVAVRTPSS